jgi:hypothetical protein
MVARTAALLCTVLMSALSPARATAADSLVSIAQAKAMSGDSGQEDGSAASSVKAKPTVKPSQSVANRGTAFQLSGVVVGPDIKYAILKHLTTNKTRTVRIGEDIDGWTAEEITPEYVLLRREDERIRVELSSRSSVVNSVGGKNILPKRSARPAQPPPAMPSSSYSRAPATQTSQARPQQRAARRAQLAAERNARRIQQQQRSAACRLQAQQQGLKRQSRRAFITACSGR